MATSTVKLNCVRFVRQVSNGLARSKYSYLAMQRDLLEKLKEAPWRLSEASLSAVTSVTNQVTRTDRVVDQETGEVKSESTFSAFIDDRYDATSRAATRTWRQPRCADTPAWWPTASRCRTRSGTARTRA